MHKPPVLFCYGGKFHEGSSAGHISGIQFFAR
jgi:hypothetical protein